MELIVAVDTLVAGVHFPIDTTAEDIGYKALAVNLSDMAAMGTEPAYATLSLTVPVLEDNWFEAFSQGFFESANLFNTQLVGVDIMEGPLVVTVSIHGYVPTGQELLRSGAQPGDHIYVTGTLGDAGLALQMLKGDVSINTSDQPGLLHQLNRPQPRIQEGMALRTVATSAIDISDGLDADLGHILASSNVGATVNVEHLPLSSVFKNAASIDMALTSGDDYELCFTVPAGKTKLVEELFSSFACGLTCIGAIKAGKGLSYEMNNGGPYILTAHSYEHFSE